MKAKIIIAFFALLGLLAAACGPPPTPEEHGLSPDTVAAICRDLEREYPALLRYQFFREFCAGTPTVPSTTTTTQQSTTTTVRPTTTTIRPTTTTTTTTTTTVPGGIRPNGPTGTFRLAWNDEFSGSSLDLSKWRPNWLAGSDTAVTPPINTAELSCYDPGHVRVSGGLLHLTADRNIPSGCRTRNGNAQYASGMVQTNSDYRFTYGYYEARMNLPGSNGRPENWPAFWSNGQSWPRDGEIDVMEVLGGEPRWHYHYESGGSHRSVGSDDDLISPKTGWHTFGVEWAPGRLTFYYDGRNVGSVTSGVVSTQHYIILNHALSSSISPPVIVPSTLQVDYVRHFVRS